MISSMKRSGPKKRPLADRFWEKVDIRGADECWPWNAGVHGSGYGSIGDEVGQTATSNRVAYELSNGPLPDGMQALHTCNNRPCCNPQHLYAGTDADNSRDRVIDGSHAGEKHHSAKLKLSDVIAIRSSGETGRALAKKYGVRESQISRIKNGTRWTHPRFEAQA